MQVLLPASVGEELMRQDAPKNGAQLFEIASSSGATTHAGMSRRLTLTLAQLTARDISSALATLIMKDNPVMLYVRPQHCGVFQQAVACTQHGSSRLIAY